MTIRIKHAFVWLRWKLFADIEEYTCSHISHRLGSLARSEYSILMQKRYFYTAAFSLDGLHLTGAISIHYHKARRDLMWRFLIKGER
jgi:hypothetical protein